MQSIKNIIEANGGLDGLQRGEAIRVLRGETCLLIEYAGLGPNKSQAVRVSEYDRKNDGVIRTPEMCFELGGAQWLPYYFRNDYNREELFIFTVYGNGHLIGINLERLRDLQRRATVWDRSIVERGFVDEDADSLYFPLFANG